VRRAASGRRVLFPVRVRENSTVLWTVVLFLGGSLLFRSLRNATEDSETWVAVLVQVGALVVLIGAVVLVVRRLR
jgi:membrane protein DedA with SNARE-associated domain